MIYEKLEVWKRSKSLAVTVYKQMANCRDFGFKDQITRCSLSVVSNIAEGMERKTNPDKARFLVIAKGSIAELKAQTQVGIEINYIPKSIGSEWLDESEIISKMLQSLMNSLTPNP